MEESSPGGAANALHYLAAAVLGFSALDLDDEERGFSALDLDDEERGGSQGRREMAGRSDSESRSSGETNREGA